MNVQEVSIARRKHACVSYFRRNKATNILAFQLYKFARYANTDAGASDMRSDRTTQKAITFTEL